MIASSGTDEKIKIWDISTGECIFTIDAHINWIWALELLDNDTLISGSEDGTIRAWDLATKKFTYQINNKNGKIGNLIGIRRLKIIEPDL